MPRKTRKVTRRQTPKARAHTPASMYHADDMYRSHGYVPVADRITESAYDLIRSRRVVIK